MSFFSCSPDQEIEDDCMPSLSASLDYDDSTDPNSCALKIELTNFGEAGINQSVTLAVNLRLTNSNAIFDTTLQIIGTQGNLMITEQMIGSLDENHLIYGEVTTSVESDFISCDRSLASNFITIKI